METQSQGSKAEAKLLKAQDVAEILSISRSLAYTLMQKGEIQTVKFRGSVRVRPEDLREFIEKNLIQRLENRS